MTPKLKSPAAVVALFVLAVVLVGCTTVAQSQFYRPANHAGEPYRISGELDAAKGWAGEVVVRINDEEVIRRKLPVFTTTTEVQGTFENKPVTVVLTRVTTLLSSYTRADVRIGNEHAATLTF